MGNKKVFKGPILKKKKISNKYISIFFGKLSNKNTKNPLISALLEKNVFHLDGLDPHILILTKSAEKRYLEFLEKFNITKEYTDTSL